MYHTYLLRLSNDTIYTGSTPNIKRRLKEHKNGLCESTQKYRPIKLIWFCSFPTRLQARRFEQYLKSGSGISFRNKHLI